MMQNNLTKISVPLDPNEWHGHSSERVWAEPLSDASDTMLFRVLSSPFFSRKISFGDVIRALPCGDNYGLNYTDTVQNGGHSTYMLVRRSDNETFKFNWQQLAAIGCAYESGSMQTSEGIQEIFSVDVPPSANINLAYAILERGESDGLWIFQEGHVGHKV